MKSKIKKITFGKRYLATMIELYASVGFVEFPEQELAQAFQDMVGGFITSALYKDGGTQVVVSRSENAKELYEYINKGGF